MAETATEEAKVGSSLERAVDLVEHAHEIQHSRHRSSSSRRRERRGAGRQAADGSMALTGDRCSGPFSTGLDTGTSAEASGVAPRTIMDFELQKHETAQWTIGALGRALESAGVEFIAENGEGQSKVKKKELIPLEF